MSMKFNPLIFSGLDLSGNGGGPGALFWGAPVDTELDLPGSGLPGECRVVKATNRVYVWDALNSLWVDSAYEVDAFGNTSAEGITLVSTVDGSILRTKFQLNEASSTTPGGVSTGTQTFAGDKEFLGLTTATGGLDASVGGITVNNIDTIEAGPADTLDIGGTNADIVNVGHAGATVNVEGTVNIDYSPADPTDWSPVPTQVIPAIDQLADRMVQHDELVKEPTGFETLTTSQTSFVDGTRIFTIQNVLPATSFDVYVKGKKFTKTSDSITLPNSPGDHYIYYNDSGVLSSTLTPTATIFQDSAMVSIIYWNTDTNTHTYFAEERHGLVMDGATHTYLHTVFGARYLSGLALQGFTIGNGSANADAQFNADQGRIRDEDLLIQISAAAQIPILYRQGQLWRKKAADAFPFIYSGTAGYVGASGRVPYNQYTGGAWQLTEIQNNKYVLIHFFGTNDKENGIVGIQGVNEYNSMEDAKNGANTEITSLGGLPFAEFVPIGTVVLQTSNTMTNTPKADVIPIDGADYIDFRGTQLYTPAGTATTHGLLSGLANDDHFQYLLVDGSRAMTGDLQMNDNSVTFVQGPNWTAELSPSDIYFQDDSTFSTVSLSANALSFLKAASIYNAFFDLTITGADKLILQSTNGVDITSPVTMSSTIDMGTNQINNLADGTANDDAATVGQLNTATSSTPATFAGFDSTSGVLTSIPGWTFDDLGATQIGAQNSLVIPPGTTDFTTLSISPSVSNTGLNNLQAIQLNPAVDQPVQFMTMFQSYGYGTSAPVNFQSFSSNPSFSGTVSTLTHFSIDGSVNATNMIGYNYFPSGNSTSETAFQATSSGTTTNYSGVSISPNGTSTNFTAFNTSPIGNTGTFLGLNVSPQNTGTNYTGAIIGGTATYTNVTGLDVNLNSITSANRKTAINAEGGNFNQGFTFRTADNLVVDSGNVIRPILEVQSGSPITGTDVILNNLSGFIDAKDDVLTAGPLNIGLTSVGFVSQLAVASGKSVPKITMCLGAAAVEATSAGGTVTDLQLFDATAINAGGTLTVTNLYGFRFEANTSAVATNTWGISIEDTSAENYIAKSLVIGGTAPGVASNSDVALEINAPKTLVLGNATTAERTAITNLAGSVIYDTDTVKPYYNDGTQWVEFGGLQPGDIAQSTATALDNQAVAQNITGLAFSNAVTRGFDVEVSIERGSTYANYKIIGIQKGSSWEMSQEYVGDDTGITFSITSLGQLQYTSTNTGSNATLKFRAETV